MSEQLRLTYRDLGNRLGLSADGARMLARRRHWPVSRGNDGKGRVTVTEAELANEAERSPRTSGGNQLNDQANVHPHIRGSVRVNDASTSEVRERLLMAEYDRERLSSELAELRRERDKLTVAVANVSERAARAEGEAHALRDALNDLAMRFDRAEARLSLPWWRRMLGA